MVAARHVDEVCNDDAAQVAQAQLPGNGLRRFQIGLEDGVFKIAGPNITPGVHIHRGQGLGLVNDQVATRLQVHTASESAGDFLVNRIQVKNRPFAFVKLQALGRLGHELAAKRLQLRVLLLRIDADALRDLPNQVAQDTLQQCQILMQQRRRRQAHGSVFDARPGLAQISDVVLQLLVAGVLGIRAQNEPTAGRPHQGLHAQAQGITLIGRDFLRHADVIVLRQKHQVPPGDADLGGQAGPLGAHRVLDDLHHDGPTFEDLLFNRHQRLTGACRGIAIGMLLPNVGHMQERGLVQTDVDEGRLHARQHTGHLAQVNIAHQASF